MSSTFEKLFAALVEEAAAAAEKRVMERLEQMTVPDRVLDVKEAAQHMGLDEKTLYRLCQEKRLPHIRAGQTNSKRPRILLRQSTLDRWLREQEEASIQKEVNTA